MTRVALFAAGLAGAFAAAFLAGSALDLEQRTVAEAASHELAAAPPAGLALEQDGYRLVPGGTSLVAGEPERYSFRIMGPDGSVVRAFDLAHERRMHLIIVSRPLKHFLHLHPTLGADGTWSVPVTLPANGSYRVFADFTTAGERHTLGIDVLGFGGPERAASGLSDRDVGMTVADDRVAFSLRGRLQRYLGAAGHVVVLREGDLAYIHTHAEQEQLAFDVRFPSQGRYRIFLQFKIRGRVETVSFGATR